MRHAGTSISRPGYWPGSDEPAEDRCVSCPVNMGQIELAELFDKYNLHALAVVDAQSRMVGAVQADHVISFLRDKL
jgi:Mg/Co/Ni transporter MgtE